VVRCPFALLVYVVIAWRTFVITQVTVGPHCERHDVLDAIAIVKTDEVQTSLAGTNLTR
jgi:hypothetical protein